EFVLRLFGDGATPASCEPGRTCIIVFPVFPERESEALSKTVATQLPRFATDAMPPRALARDGGLESALSSNPSSPSPSPARQTLPPESALRAASSSNAVPPRTAPPRPRL